MVKRHTRPQQVRRRANAEQTVGGVIEREGPIHVSNVMLLDAKGNAHARAESSARTASACASPSSTGARLD